MSNELQQKTYKESFPHKNFSGEFGEIWEKYPSHRQKIAFSYTYVNYWLMLVCYYLR